MTHDSPDGPSDINDQIQQVVTFTKTLDRITWKAAVQLAAEILERAEKQRAEQYDREAKVGIQYKD